MILVLEFLDAEGKSIRKFTAAAAETVREPVTRSSGRRSGIPAR